MYRQQLHDGLYQHRYIGDIPGDDDWCQWHRLLWLCTGAGPCRQYLGLDTFGEYHKGRYYDPHGAERRRICRQLRGIHLLQYELDRKYRYQLQHPQCQDMYGE